MKIVICFNANTFNNCADALDFISPFIRVDLVAISSNKSFSNGFVDFNIENAIQNFKNNGDISFSVVSKTNDFDAGETSLTFRKDPLYFADLFWLTFENEEKIKIDEFIIAASKLKFTTACKFDFNKSKWQNEEIIANFDYFKKPYEHLPKVINPALPPILRTKIDIFQNPGHQKLTGGLYLMAAPEMWFGPGSMDFFDKKRLLSFPNAIENAEIVPDLVYVKLFEWNMPDYETSEILNLQKSFRGWTKMDDIELQLNNVMEQKRRSNR